MPDAGEAELEDLVERVIQVAPESINVFLRGDLFGQVDFKWIFRKLTQPTLLLHGDWVSGAMVRQEDVGWLRNLIPSVQVKRIPDGSHLFLWEQPEVSIRAIEDYLATLSSGN